MSTDRAPIEVTYTCGLCGMIDCPVTVPSRLPGDDISGWMEMVIGQVGADHHRRSPNCYPQTLTNLKIPIPNGDNAYVGKPRLS